MSRFFTAVTLVSVAQALAFDGKPARATDAVVPDATFYRPEITSPPYIRQLLAEDASNDTVYIAPDNTCGYVDGRPGRLHIPLIIPIQADAPSQAPQLHVTAYTLAPS